MIARLDSTRFARRYFGSRCRFFDPGTEMFQFPGCARSALTGGRPGLGDRGVSPFGDPRIAVCYATPRGLSWRATTFIAHPHPRHPPCALLSFLL